MKHRPRIALWHRYGPGGHTACGGHAIPLVIEQLARDFEVHYFGMHGRDPVPERIAANATLHYLPVTFDRANPRHKITRTLLWYLAMPCMALKCRFMGVKLIFIDETLPLNAPIVKLFFGNNIALTVMDFFLDIYFEKAMLPRPLLRFVKACDTWAWRRIPILFTKVNHTHQYLTGLGVPSERIHTVYNPVDTTVFHPLDKAACRRKYGYGETEIVMVHHGILHPNKNNDLPIRALAELKATHPALRFLLIGDGPEMGHLKRLVTELDVANRVTFTGWLPTEADLNEALNAADIGLVLRIGQPTDHFHLTDTLSHQMACGLPILAVNLKGIAEAVKDGQTGYLFDADDMDTFKQRLTELATAPSLRGQFGTAALKTSRRLCSIDHAVEGIVSPMIQLIKTE
jgi:glycosyltransferase involved in cell wall biosynthesis